MSNNTIKIQRADSAMRAGLLLHDLMKLNPDDVIIQKEFQKTINILFEKFPDALPSPKSFAD
jgi:hypothetical protein